MGLWATAEIFKEQTERLTLFSQYRRFIHFHLEYLKVWEATTFPSVFLRTPIRLQLELVLRVSMWSCSTSVTCWIGCFYFVNSERKSYLCGLRAWRCFGGMLPGWIYAAAEGMKISLFVLLRDSFSFTAEHNRGYRLAAQTVLSTVTIVLFPLWTTVLFRWHIAPMQIVCDDLLRTL